MFHQKVSFKCSNVGFVLLIVLLAFASFGQTPVAADIRPLPAGKTVEREIKAAEEHFYTVKLKAGEVMRLVLEEGQNVNYVFQLINADSGQTITEVDLTSTFGREAITYIAATEENLKVLVRAPEKMTALAIYKLTATVSERATEEDKEKIKAEELSQEISRLYKEAFKPLLANRNEIYQKAITLGEEALTLRQKQNDKFWECWTTNFLGILYYQLNNEKAIKYYEKSLAISRELKAHRIENSILVYLGWGYKNITKQYEKAVQYFEQTLSKLQKTNLLQDAFQANQAFQNPEDVDLLTTLVDLYAGLKNPQLAIFYGKQQINNYQIVRSEVKDFDKITQLSFVKDKEPAYRKLVDLLISEARFAEAQTVLDLLKKEEFRNYTVRRTGESSDTVPYSKAEADVAAKVENLARLERERSELLTQKEQSALPADKQSRLDQIAAEIEAANRAFRLALDELAKSESSVESKVAEIKSEKSLQRALSQLQKETGSGVVALYTVLGAESEEEGKNADGKAKTKFGWIILVTPTSRKAYPIDVADLEQTVFAFRETLQSDKYDPQPLAQKLYQKLFRQTSEKQKTTLEQDLETLLGKEKNKTLMWFLDGILRYVPMAALHDGKGYLVEKYRNALFTKESFLTLTEKDNLKWQALGLGVSEARENFSPLPGAERELCDIVRERQAANGVIDGSIRLNKEFKEEETFRLWSEGGYPVVHIASHYVFNPTDPTSSFLLVGDGQLTFAEMQDKDLLFGAIDLLTLSACDTAMVNNGKEAEGFAYLAQSLGAKSVIASLWKISDAGTPELMIRFYKLRAGNSAMPKGEAFRLAQFSLLGAETRNMKSSLSKRSEVIDLSGKKIELPLYEKDSKRPFAHPHYWSSFVLIGNWR